MSAFGGKAPACAHSAICPPRSVYLRLSISVAKTNGRKSRTHILRPQVLNKGEQCSRCRPAQARKNEPPEKPALCPLLALTDITADVRLLRRYAGRQRHRLISTILELDDHEDHLVVADIFQIVNCEFALA
jgi:hypothetical protein